MAEFLDLFCLCCECLSHSDTSNVNCNCCDSCEKAMTKRRCWCRNEMLYPLMTYKNAKTCYKLNCCPLTAGWGTILAACLAFKAKPMEKVKMILIGLLYWLLMPVLCIGWCHSVKYGRRLKMKADKYRETVDRLGYYALELRESEFHRKKQEGEF